MNPINISNIDYFNKNSSDSDNDSDNEYDDLVNKFKEQYINEKDIIKEKEQALISEIIKNNTLQYTNNNENNYESAIQSILNTTSQDMRKNINSDGLDKVNNLLGINVNASIKNDLDKDNNNQDINDSYDKASNIRENNDKYIGLTYEEIITLFYKTHYKIDITEEQLFNLCTKLNNFFFVQNSDDRFLRNYIFYLSINNISNEPKLKQGKPIWIGNKKMLLCDKGSKWVINNNIPLFMNENLYDNYIGFGINTS